MDQNFSDILNIFKRLDESSTNARQEREHDHDEEYNPHTHADAPERKPQSEGSMADAEHHHSGPEFTGYWKGTDPRTPGQHMVGGGCEEDVEVPTGLAECEPGEKITTRKGDYSGTVEKIEGGKVYFRTETGKLYRTPVANIQKSVEEDNIAGAGSTGTTGAYGAAGSTDPVERQKAAAAMTAAQQAVQKTKSAIGMPPGVSPTKVAQTLINPPANPQDFQKANPDTKKITGSLGGQFEKFLGTAAKDNPAALQSVLQKMQQVNKAS